MMYYHASTPLTLDILELAIRFKDLNDRFDISSPVMLLLNQL